jgi:hypothetical protein
MAVVILKTGLCVINSQRLDYVSPTPPTSQAGLVALLVRPVLLFSVGSQGCRLARP